MPPLARFTVLLLTATLAAAPAAAVGEPPSRWLIGYHKALFWMSEVEVRFFYDIAEAFTPQTAADGRDLKLIAASTAPFAGREWEVDFLLRRGRLAAIGLEHEERAMAPEACAARLDDWLRALDRLHGAVSERPVAGRDASQAALVFNWGARWELATAYDAGLCRSRMDLKRAPPSRG
ncbi:hypothetical protein [Algihabitans albus]|uniref:hypothetical protein n=1 Tax=Algihabitans albus TaxID=2164067 RepID=UPI000E5D2B36|nr:hypothetical protein [Algihabitans albus]